MKDLTLSDSQRDTINNCIDEISQILTFTSLSDNERYLLTEASNKLELFRFTYKPVDI